jgi:hypothetical protein
MPVRTNAKDDAVTGMSGTEPANKALIGERYAPGGLECKGHIPDEYQLPLVRHTGVDGVAYWTCYLPRYLSAYSGRLLPLLFSWDGIYGRGSPAWGDYEEN